jgi:hypothetical protein
VIGEGILTAIQRTAIRILRKMPNAQATLTSGITCGMQFTLLYRGGISDFPVIAEKVFWKGGVDYY